MLAPIVELKFATNLARIPPLPARVLFHHADGFLRSKRLCQPAASRAPWMVESAQTHMI